MYNYWQPELSILMGNSRTTISNVLGEILTKYVDDELASSYLQNQLTDDLENYGGEVSG